MGEIHEDPQVQHSDVFEMWDSGTALGTMRMPRHAPLFHGSPVGSPGPVPNLGADTEQVLAELGAF